MQCIAYSHLIGKGISASYKDSKEGTTMKVCYFTATGNCLYVAKRIGSEALSIPQLMKQDRIELTDDAVGILCPVYGV
mgnify:CR=1 FL=1